MKSALPGAILLLLAGLPLEAQQLGGESFREFTGCYRLEQDTAALVYQHRKLELDRLPQFIQLHDESTANGFVSVPAYMLTANPAMHPDYSYGLWFLRDVDQLHVAWSSNGWNGIRLQLTPEGNDLVGLAEVFSDVGSIVVVDELGRPLNEQSRPVRAVRVSCSLPPV